MVRPIAELFPALARNGFQITSPVDKHYICIAHAAGDSTIWWWPFPENVPEVYWPPNVARAETLDAFRAMFESLGYIECVEDAFEHGFERIALFADDQRMPLRAARQRPNGLWTSKLGEREDIDHDLRDLEGETYGQVVLIMKRPTL